MFRKYLLMLLPMAFVSGVAHAAASTAEMDCLFNWAERTYPQLFAPAQAASGTLGTYYYRHYTGTKAYLGVDRSSQHAVFLPADSGQVQDLGDVAPFIAAAGCGAPSASTNYAGTWTWSYGSGSAYSVQLVVTQDGNNLAARIPLTGQTFAGRVNGNSAVFTETDGIATAQATVTLIDARTAELTMNSCAPALMCIVPAGTVLRLTR